MSSNANSNREDDEFFSPGTADDKPKAPGSFTQSFMATGTPTGPASLLDPKTPASPTPFTAEFGNVNSLGSFPESGTDCVPARVSGASQQSASAGSGAFTTMFGSNAPAQKQSSEPQTEVTRVFDRPATNPPVPSEARPSESREMFSSAPPAAPENTQPSVASSPSGAKTPNFTELFKSPAAAAPSTPAAQVPLSPLSAQSGTGRFTELFKNESTFVAPKPVSSPTPFSSGPSGFTGLFKSSSISAQPSATPPTTVPATESTSGGFTQLFKGSLPSARPTPTPPKPAGELTQMISGSGLSPSSANPGSTPQAGATRLFSGESSAPAMAPPPSGPSEYTRVVSPRQLRELQQTAPAANNSAPPAATGQTPAMPGAPQMPAWPTASAPLMPTVAPAPAPQFASPPMPQGVPPWQPPQVPNLAAAFPPATPPPVPKAESKILTYLPLIIGLNVLFLIAVLLILLFALKR